MKKTRSQVVWKYAYDSVIHSGTSWPTFAAIVRDNYEAGVPESARRIEFSRHSDSYQRMRLDAQTLRRFESEARIGLPADLEEAIVKALPEPWYTRCLRELAARYGLLAAPIPANSGSHVANLAALAREFSDVVRELSPALVDGKLDNADRCYAKQILAEVSDLEAQLAALRHVLAPLVPADVVRLAHGGRA